MTEFETMVLVCLVLVAVAITVYIKLKQAEKRIEAMFKLEEARRFDEAQRQRIKNREGVWAALEKLSPAERKALGL
jgi:hypothetical protein